MRINYSQFWSYANPIVFYLTNAAASAGLKSYQQENSKIKHAQKAMLRLRNMSSNNLAQALRRKSNLPTLCLETMTLEF
jgi:hypothetical protein